MTASRVDSQTSDTRVILLCLVLAVLGLLGLGCSGGGDRSSSGEEAESVADLTVTFRHVLDDAPIRPDQLIYRNAAGNEYSVTTFEYLITDVRLRKADGTDYLLAEAIYGNAFELGDLDYVFRDVPSGEYTGISFQWGVSPELNLDGYLDSTFDGMAWPPPLGGGYHNMRFEGSWSRATPGDASFAVHTGNLRRCLDMGPSFEDCPESRKVEFTGSFTVNLPTAGFDMEKGEDWFAEISIDAGAWFDDPEYDLGRAWADQGQCPASFPSDCLLGFPTMPGSEPQQRIYDSRSGVFELKSLVEGQREEYGTLSMRFRHRVDGERLRPAELRYVNEAGNAYSVTKFEYLITEIRLRGDSGQSVVLADAIYGNAIEQGEIEYLFSDVPVGDYTSISFQWGVAPSENVSGGLPADFDGMAWPPIFGGGYHNMRFEGEWTASSAGDSSFAVHTGNLRRCLTMGVDFANCESTDRVTFDGSFEVEIQAPDLRIEAGESWNAEIAIDLNGWLNDPEYNFGKEWSDPEECPLRPGPCLLSFPTMPGGEAQELIYQNRDDVFELLSVWEGQAASTGDVSLVFYHVNAGAELMPRSLDYVNEAGNSYSVTRFDYLITDISLNRTDGITVPLGDVIYGDAITQGEIAHTFSDVPAGSYESIRFTWGVPAEMNEAGFLSGDYDLMGWPSELGGGYYAMRLEGFWTDLAASAPGFQSYSLHTGFLRRCLDEGVGLQDCPPSRLVEFDGSFEIELDTGEFRVGKEDRWFIEASVDVNRWMSAPVYDLAQEWADQSECPISPDVCTLGSPTSSSVEAQQDLYENRSDVFALIDVSEASMGSPIAMEVDLDIAPYGLANWPLMPVPDDNPTTREGIALGRHLFYDPILSRDGSMSCGTCHRQEFAFADPRRFSLGVNGEAGVFNAPALANLGWASGAPFNKIYSAKSFALFWDGHAGSLEHQSTFPVEDPLEMDRSWDAVVREMQSHSSYPDMFEAAFGSRHVTIEGVTRALAQFQRTFRSYNSKWDRVQRGEESLSPSEQRGYDAFVAETGDCFHCHGGNFALMINPSNSFANNGLDAIPEAGLRDSTSFFLHEGLFKTPTLRNVEVTAPYMHDGRFNTLEEVLEFYSTGVHIDSKNLNSALRARVIAGPIDPAMQSDIIAFLKTRTDDEFLTNPDLASPF